MPFILSPVASCILTLHEGEILIPILCCVLSHHYVGYVYVWLIASLILVILVFLVSQLAYLVVRCRNPSYRFQDAFTAVIGVVRVLALVRVSLYASVICWLCVGPTFLYNFLNEYDPAMDLVPLCLQTYGDVESVMSLLLLDGPVSLLTSLLPYDSLVSYAGHSSVAGLVSLVGSEYIPWHDTAGSATSRLMLQRQYQYAEVHLPQLHQYLTQYCAHHLDPPVGNTGILANSVTSESLVSNAIRAFKTTGLEAMGPHRNDAGVYVFHCPSDGYTYVGSSIYFESRMGVHMSCYRNAVPGADNLYDHMRTVGLQAYTVGVPVLTTNHMNRYMAMYPDTTGSSLKPVIHRILQDYSWYECRLYEQALITHMQPNNPSNTVLFPHAWTEGATIQSEGRVLEGVTETGQVIPYNSVMEASRMTGHRTNTIRRNLNYAVYLNSKVLGCQIRFQEPGASIMEGTAWDHRKTVEGIDYSSLSPYVIYIYDAQLQLLDTFASVSRAATHYGVHPKLLYTAMNHRFISLLVAGVATQVLVARNPKTPLKPHSDPVVCEDKSTGSVLVYSSMAACGRGLGMKQAGSNWVLEYVGTGKAYKGRYLVSYYADYNGTPPTGFAG